MKSWRFHPLPQPILIGLMPELRADLVRGSLLVSQARAVWGAVRGLGATAATKGRQTCQAHAHKRQSARFGNLCKLGRGRREEQPPQMTLSCLFAEESPRFIPA